MTDSELLMDRLSWRDDDVVMQIKGEPDSWIKRKDAGRYVLARKSNGPYPLEYVFLDFETNWCAPIKELFDTASVLSPFSFKQRLDDEPFTVDVRTQEDLEAFWSMLLATK